jgi:hypothetical protein
MHLPGFMAGADRFYAGSKPTLTTSATSTPQNIAALTV